MWNCCHLGDKVSSQSVPVVQVTAPAAATYRAHPPHADDKCAGETEEPASGQAKGRGAAWYRHYKRRANDEPGDAQRRSEVVEFEICLMAHAQPASTRIAQQARKVAWQLLDHGQGSTRLAPARSHHQPQLVTLSQHAVGRGRASVVM